MAAAAANALNCYIGRDIDARMERTRNRPLPSQQIRARSALVLGLTLALLATGLLYAAAGATTAALGLNAWFVWHVVRVLRERSDAAARRAFRVSLIYLSALFLAMLVDRAL